MPSWAEEPIRIPTFAQFGLPAELTTQIIELAAIAPCNPRVFTIFQRKDGQLYTRKRAPALLHVNFECRDFMLKMHKPWLPQFKGTKAHEPYEVLAKKKGATELSRLQNIYIDLEHDTVLMNWWAWHFDFGNLEYYNLRSLCLNVKGYVSFPEILRYIRKFKNLRVLHLYDSNRTGGIEWKVRRISALLWGEQEKDRKQPRKRIPNYIAPEIKSGRVEEIPLQIVSSHAEPESETESDLSIRVPERASFRSLTRRTTPSSNGQKKQQQNLGFQQRRHPTVGISPDFVSVSKRDRSPLHKHHHEPHTSSMMSSFPSQSVARMRARRLRQRSEGCQEFKPAVNVVSSQKPCRAFVHVKRFLSYKFSRGHNPRGQLNRSSNPLSSFARIRNKQAYGTRDTNSTSSYSIPPTLRSRIHRLSGVKDSRSISIETRHRPLEEVSIRSPTLSSCNKRKCEETLESSQTKRTRRDLYPSGAVLESLGSMDIKQARLGAHKTQVVVQRGRFAAWLRDRRASGAETAVTTAPKRHNDQTIRHNE